MPTVIKTTLKVFYMQKLATSQKKSEECARGGYVSHRTCRNCGGTVSRIALNDIFVSGG